MDMSTKGRDKEHGASTDRHRGANEKGGDAGHDDRSRRGSANELTRREVRATQAGIHACLLASV